jgi:hypothetical protein
VSAPSAHAGNVPPPPSQSNSGNNRQGQASRAVQPTLPNRNRGNGQESVQIIHEAWVFEKVAINLNALIASTSEGTLYLIVDSGASIHAVGAYFYPYLINWRRGPTRRITIANSAVCESDYIADLPLTLQTSDGPKTIILQDVVYMEEFPKGLISVAKLAERGVEMIFRDDMCFIRSKNVYIEIQKNPQNDLYHLETSLSRAEDTNRRIEEVNLEENDSIPITQIDENSISANLRKLYDLHSSLGHCNMQTLQTAIANGHITGITFSDLSHTLENCEICKTAKLHAHTT